MIIEETRLWRAVLQQAYDDAELAESLELDWEPELRVQARAFLRADTPDDAALLKRVCHLADVPADRVYLWARQRYPLAAEQCDLVPCDGIQSPTTSHQSLLSTGHESRNEPDDTNAKQEITPN